MAFAQYLIDVFAPVGGRVLDPFCGSGTTLFAAETLGVRGTGIELEPASVDLFIARLQKPIPALKQNPSAAKRKQSRKRAKRQTITSSEVSDQESVAAFRHS